MRSVWLALALVTLGSPSTSVAETGLERVRRTKVLRWAGDIQGGEPYVFYDPQDATKLIGFEVEIADGLGRELGVKAEFVQNTWSTLEPSLRRGDFDVIMNGLEETPARREMLALSQPYYHYAERLTVRRGFPAPTLADMRGKRVATLASSYAYDLLMAHEALPVTYEGVEEQYIDLVHGRVDGVLLDDIIADRYGSMHKELVNVGSDVAVGGYVIAGRLEDRDLVRALDEAMERMRARGELGQIYDRWKLTRRAPKVSTAGAAEPAVVPRRMLGGQGMLFVRGAAMTALVSVLAMALAIPLGLLLAIARLHGGRVLAFAATAYIELWRGTPVLLQLYLLYYGLAPIVELGPLVAAILGLGMNYAAYEAEVYRGAMQAVPVGQTEAARSLGLSGWQTLRHIVLPQAIRTALPSVTNDFVALLKDSSLVSVITVVELTKQMTITAVDVRSWVIPGLACAALYFAMSFPLARVAGYLERRMAA